MVYYICIPKNLETIVSRFLLEAPTRFELLVEFARQQKARLVIRGLRAITDFEYEIQMSQTNHKLEPEVETMFLTTNLKYSYLSSTIVREVAAFGGDISQFVPETVAKSIKEKMSQ